MIDLKVTMKVTVQEVREEVLQGDFFRAKLLCDYILSNGEVLIALKEDLDKEELLKDLDDVEAILFVKEELESEKTETFLNVTSVLLQNESILKEMTEQMEREG